MRRSYGFYTSQQLISLASRKDWKWGKWLALSKIDKILLKSYRHQATTGDRRELLLTCVSEFYLLCPCYNMHPLFAVSSAVALTATRNGLPQQRKLSPITSRGSWINAHVFAWQASVTHPHPASNDCPCPHRNLAAFIRRSLKQGLRAKKMQIPVAQLKETHS